MFDFPEKIGITIYRRDRKLCHVTVDGEVVVTETYSLYDVGMLVNELSQLAM